jgi:hypothetical protein
LIGAAYDRKIYGFEVDTSEEQDREFIRRFNSARNKSHFNLLFHNCADFSRKVVDFYYPGAVHRGILDDGIMTPKQAAKSLTRYGHKHERVNFATFVIPQVAGTVPRSRNVDGVLEALIKSKKYVVPLAALHPVITAGLAAGYLGSGRFHPPKDAPVLNVTSQGLDEISSSDVRFRTVP